jgi:hypothetical protein
MPFGDMNNSQRGPQHALDALVAVVAKVTYKPGWRVWLDYMPRATEQYTGSEGLTLRIAALVFDSRDPGYTTPVEHWMAVPPTSWDRPTWERWVLDQLILVERHEAMEFYAVGGHKVFFPAHGPGRDPYAIERC